MTHGLRLAHQAIGGIVLLVGLIGCQGTGKKLEASQPIKAWNPPTGTNSRSAAAEPLASRKPEMPPPRLNVEPVSATSPTVRTVGTNPPRQSVSDTMPPIQGDLVVPKIEAPTPLQPKPDQLNSSSVPVIPPSPPGIPGSFANPPATPPIAGPAAAPIMLGEK